MIKTISTAFAVFAVVTFVGFSGQADAQNCSSCGSASSFSYPAGSSCGRGGCLGNGKGHGKGHGHGARFGELKNQLDHQAAINAKADARNNAWPKPFACQDRRNYHLTWGTMLAAGRETQGVLDSKFFTDGNELNRIGIDRIAEIALTSPVNERFVYVSRSADQSVDQVRMEAIRDTIATYYSHRGHVDVRLSDRTAPAIAATKVQAVNQLYEDNRPPATIFDVEDVNNAVQSQ